MRRQIFLGANLSAAVDTRGPRRRSWPDIDALGVQWDTGIEQLYQGRAVAISLNSETDWDLVRVYFDSELDRPQLLGPGMFLLVPQGRRIVRIEPVTLAPATRLYDGTNLRNGVLQPPAVPAGVSFAADGTRLNNASGAGIVVYKWLGTAWDAGTAIANGANDPRIQTDITANANPTNRPSDFSLDAQWTLADQILAGHIDDSGFAILSPVIASASPLDAHGNAGDPTNGSTKLYLKPNGGLVRFGDLSPLFFGRLALDVWDDCPPREAPPLPPVRYVTFGQVSVLATPAYPAAPDQPLLTFPVGNAKRVEFLFHNNGPGEVTVVIVSPAPSELISGVAGVVDADPAPAAQWSTIGAGADGSYVLEDPAHPFCKILVGGNNNANVIAAGAILTVKRELAR